MADGPEGDAPLFNTPVVRRRGEPSEAAGPPPPIHRRQVETPGAPPGPGDTQMPPPATGAPMPPPTTGARMPPSTTGARMPPHTAGAPMPPPTTGARTPPPVLAAPPRAISVGPIQAAIVGVVDGAVTVETRRPEFWGWRAAAAAAVVAGAVGVAVPGLPALTRVGLVALTVVAVGGAVLAIARRRADRTGRGDADPDRRTIVIHRFRVRSHTGEVVACVLYGDLSGGEVRHGDLVRVDGKRSRDGQVVARRVGVLAPPAGPVVSHVTARPPAGLRVAGWSSWCGFAVAAAELVATAAAVIGRG